ncbi:MAG: ABC transporter ATP-binding protein, partial [Gemmataceae bacterium]
MPEPLLTLTGIQKSYRGEAALRGIDLTIDRGEVFGLLGPNGAGKTTLLSIIAGLLPPDAGTMHLAGQAYSGSDRTRRRLIGIGTQDLAVYPDLTARENLHFFGKLYGDATSSVRSRADELLQAVGLSDRAQQRVGGFSGGMKRRLNLAVAVMHRPELLLLDEPTTGVDPQSRNLIYEMVRQLQREGLTIIYT